MPQVGVAVLKEARAGAHGLDQTPLGQHRADRLITAPQAFGHRQQVRHHTLLLAGVQAAGSAHAAHHLIQDQQHTIAIADLAHGPEITRHWGEHTRSCAPHGFRHKGHHPVLAQTKNGLLELAGQAQSVHLGGFAISQLAVGVAGGQVRGRHQQRGKGFAAPGIAANGQGAQRIAVVTLTPGDEVLALGLSDLDKILAGHLQRGFDRLRSTAHEIHMAHAIRCGLDEPVGQLFGHFRGEETGVGVRQLVNLAVHGGQHIGMGMPEARHGSTTGSIQIAFALRVKQKDTFTFGRHGRHLLQLTVHHSGGGGGHAGFRVEEMSGLWAVGGG